MRKKAGILFLFKCIKIPLSILLLALTAKYFGVSIGREVWLLAFSTMMALDTALWGPINESFRAKFIFLKEAEGEQKAIEYTQSLLFYIFLFSVILMVLIMCLPKVTATLVAPKYTNEAFELLQIMLIYTAPILLFSQAVQIGNSILNAYGIFYVPEISGFINLIINLIFLILLAPHYGYYALLISYFISVLINLIFIGVYIIKSKIPLFNTDWNFSFLGFKMFFLFSFPFFFPYFLGQINIITEKILAGTLGIGTVGIMDYSNRIPTMLYGVVISIISTLLLPVLADSFSKKNGAKYISDFQSIYQMGLLMLGFVIVFMIGAAQPLVSLLYDSKNISPSELQQIVILTKIYSITLLGIFLYTIFGMSMMASKKNKKYAFLGVLTQLIVICFNLIFVYSLKIYVFPISITIAHILTAYFMFKHFPYKDNEVIKITVKYLLLIIIAAILVAFIKDNISIKNSYLNIIFIGINQIIILIVLMYIIKIEELDIFLSKVTKIKNQYMK